MTELRFDSVDGDRLRLVDDQGQAYGLVVDHTLRMAVRPGPAQRSGPAIEPGQDLRPKDIQALIRSGVEPEELAQAAGLDADLVDRYAQPVLDERAYIAHRARATRIRPDDEAPLLGDITVDRLATLNVETAAVRWDAVREDGHWVVSVSYNAEAGPATARWLVDLAAAKITALDDEAAWITETDIDATQTPAVRPKTTGPALQPLFGGTQGHPIGADGDSAPVSELSPTLALLDDLMANRGIRQPVEPPPVELPVKPKPPGQAEVLTLVRAVEETASDEPATPAYSRTTTVLPGDQGELLDDLDGADLPDRRSIHDRVNNLDLTTVLDRLPRMGSLLEEDASVGVEMTPQAEPSLATTAPAQETVLLEVASPSPAFPTGRSDGLTAVPEVPDEEPQDGTSPPKARNRSKRSSVPSWDEIVFGAKPER